MLRSFPAWDYLPFSSTLVRPQTVSTQVVGGRPPRYAHAQACNGSAQRQPWPRPAEPGPISQYAPSSTGRCGPKAAAQLQPIPYACGAQRALLPIAVSSMNINELMNINDVCESATIFPRPCKLTFNLLTYKVVSESRATWATCVPIMVFLGIFVLQLFPKYVTDRRQTSDRQTDRRQTRIIA